MNLILVEIIIIMSPYKKHTTLDPSSAVTLPSHTQELRNRRARIIRDKIRDAKEEKEFSDIVRHNTNHTTGQFFQVAIVVITALIVTVGALLQYTKPNFIRDVWKRNRHQRQQRPFYLATKYPDSVLLERDLPRFFRTYSIATPDNIFAQEAVRKINKSRNHLKRRLGSNKAILKAWDQNNIQTLLKRGVCGEEFTIAYQKGTDSRKHDLLMWCLLATRIVEGYFQETVEFIDTPLFLTKQRGIVVKKKKKQQSNEQNDVGYDELSHSLYFHPRLNKTSLEWIPSKAFAMIISTPEDIVGGPSDAIEMLQRYLYELVSENEEDFLILDEVCQESRPERAVAIDCPNGHDDNIDCCYFVVPEKYGGRFEDRHDE